MIKKMFGFDEKVSDLFETRAADINNNERLEEILGEHLSEDSTVAELMGYIICYELGMSPEDVSITMGDLVDKEGAFDGFMKLIMEKIGWMYQNNMITEFNKAE